MPSQEGADCAVCVNEFGRRRSNATQLCVQMICTQSWVACGQRWLTYYLDCGTACIIYYSFLFVLPVHLLLLSSSSSSSSSSTTTIIVVHVHYHSIIASLVSLLSNDILNLCIVINYLCIQAWFSLVHKTKKATQSLLSCLSVDEPLILLPQNLVCQEA